MIPEPEQEALQRTLGEARECARSGRLAEGCRSLVRGLDRAHALAARGVAWGRDLVQRYREAIEEFRRHAGYRHE